MFIDLSRAGILARRGQKMDIAREEQATRLDPGELS